MKEALKKYCLSTVFAMISALLMAAPAWSSGWDARTRLTNVAVHDADVKAALNQGISLQFQQTFPMSHYGIYVLVDKSNANTPTNGVVYIMLGLSKRHPDGSYDLPEVTYSSMLVLSDQHPASERAQIVSRLTEQAAVFANAAVQNAGRLR